MITEMFWDYKGVTIVSVGASRLESLPLVHEVADLPHQGLVLGRDGRGGRPVVVETRLGHPGFEVPDPLLPFRNPAFQVLDPTIPGGRRPALPGLLGLGLLAFLPGVRP